MKLYLDGGFRCHVAPAEGRREVETDFFDGRCAAWIEGFRLVPEGENWTREDGTVFRGEMIAPWKDCAELESAQLQWLEEQAADMREALALLGVRSDD